MRRQFGPPGQEEIPVLEYQMQVSKLLVKPAKMHSSLLQPCSLNFKPQLASMQATRERKSCLHLILILLILFQISNGDLFPSWQQHMLLLALQEFSLCASSNCKLA